MHHFSSIEKIKDSIGWEPKWRIEDGIYTTIEWWKNNREIWLKYSENF